ncbi:MAG: 3-oxoacyl-[acyl-carrier-protein] reductase FabG [Legionellaceae bacterium]
MTLKGQIALVTGATRGIGHAIAIELGKQGAIVYGTATTDAGAKAISAYLQKENIMGEGFILDVTQPESIENLVNHITKKGHAAPSILVNNAGITRDNLLLRMKDEEWDAVINTNLNAVYRLTKAFIKPMIKARTGRIINISSVVGSSGNSGQANYCAAKAGLIGFTKALALELASRQITVNAVAPGFIDTDMTRDLPTEHKDTLLNKIPLQRLGEPQEIAATVAFLASARAGYITGQTLHVNGGMYMS